jgi:hypothetical protein
MHRSPRHRRSDATRLGYAIRTIGGTLVLALALAAPTLADNPGKPDSPGKSASAPGQLKKQAPPATPAQPSPGKSAAAPGHQKQSGKPPKPQKAKKSGKPAKAARPPATTTKTAHQKVTLCHSTGSAKNPYVEITVSVNAVAAHRRHHDGRDIIPAPAGGCPRGSAASAGEKPEKAKPAKSHEKVTICHATGSETNPYVKITIAMSGWLNGHRKHGGDILLASADASCPGVTAASGQPASGPTQGSIPGGPNVVTAGGVKGASATRHAALPASAQGRSKPRGGVLGATASAGRALGSTAVRTLPFTGLPLWLPVAAALALLAGGLLLRRQARAR